MKKSFRAAIIAALAIAIAGCGQQPNTTATTSGTTSTTGTDASTTDTTSTTDDSKDLFELYRSEVSRRLSSDEDFISEEEVARYTNNGYVIGNLEGGLILRNDTLYNNYQEYYYPVIIATPDGVDHMVYCWENGEVLVDPSLPGTNYLGILHLSQAESKALGEVESLEREYTHTTVYLPEMGEVRTYKFGQLQDTTPARGTYIGESAFVGHLFRDGQDVYALRGDTFYPIAHGVLSVLEANYRLTSDQWSQPLLLMEDGSVKAYSMMPSSAEPDSVEHLVDPQYEGGYR